MTEPVNLLDVREMHAAIATDNSQEISELAARDPRLLIWPYQGASPLARALKSYRDVSAKTLLDEITARRGALHGPLPQEWKMLRSDPLYVYNDNSPDGKLPHAYAVSQEQFDLLLQHGYDFNARTAAYSLHSDLLNRLPEDPSVSRLTKAVECGMEINAPHRDGKPYPHPGERFVATSNIDPGFQYLIKILARLGLDLRSTWTRLLGDRANDPNLAKFPDSLFIPEAREALTELGNTLPARFLAKTDPEARRQTLRTACAIGTFPALLSSLAQKHDEANIAVAVSLLDDYWRGEYKNTVRTAQATLARKIPMEQNALQQWAGATR